VIVLDNHGAEKKIMIFWDSRCEGKKTKMMKMIRKSWLSLGKRESEA